MMQNKNDKVRYNGIQIPLSWQFYFPKSGDVVVPPYLIPKEEGGYAPDVVNVDRGRQLFVDDFLIEQTDLNRTYYAAKKSADNPILQAEMPWEMRGCGGTPATSGGFWYDSKEKKYKLWYEAGFNVRLAYAESDDGIHWTRPAIQEDGSNILLPDVETDSYSIWIDDEAPAEERYKMMIRCPNVPPCGRYRAQLYLSGDGIHWREIGETGMMGDRSTFFYNPFTKKWCISIRSDGCLLWRGKNTWTRWRQYSEGDTLLEAGAWESLDDTPLWQAPDSADEIDTTLCNHPPQIYNSDTIAYESLLLGVYQMWLGPENDVIEVTKLPKITEIQLGFSRDGFYFDRPWRHPFIPATRKEGAWDYGYLQSPTGGVIVYDDEIRIYYSGFSGIRRTPEFEEKFAYGGGAIGYATLRRDGFASMDGNGTLLTKKLTLTKDVHYMFVNVDTKDGGVRAELLDENGHVLEGCGLDACEAIRTDSTKVMVTWRGVKDLSFLRDRVFQVKFYMGSGKLYSFWFSKDETGTSDGEMAAGYAGAKPTGSAK